MARALVDSCRTISMPSDDCLWACSSSETRVIITPAATEISSDGICETMASPIDSTAKRLAASPAVMLWYVMPITMPARMLTSVMTRPAMASPLTNFMAPSMPPCSWLSIASSARRLRASSGDRWPARRSASMLICLPGMASSVKRAPTSATRSEPLAITMNCTVVMIRNTTRPTTRLPPTTSLPKLSMMWPASACSRMDLVEAMFSDSRSSVVNSSSDGNADSEVADGMYIVTISSTTESVMFRPSSASISMVGSGSTISATTATTSAAIPISPLKSWIAFFLAMSGSGQDQCWGSAPGVPEAPISPTHASTSATVSKRGSGTGP